MNMTLFRLKTSSYPLNYFGQGMAAATPCHMGSSATDSTLISQIYLTDENIVSLCGAKRELIRIVPL